MKTPLIFGLCLTLGLSALAQTEYAYQTFDDTRVVNGHSIETNTEGILKFIISHRFGRLSSGAQEAWGLDLATMRIGLDYGITNNITVGVGRSTFEKTVDTYAKYKVLAQSTGDRTMPVSVTMLGTAAWETLKLPNDNRDFNQRLAYAAQLLIARKLTDRFSAQLMPTFLHRNLVGDLEQNDIFSMGLAAQYQVVKNISVSVEYYATPKSSLPAEADLTTAQDPYTQSLAIGVQIDTKGHIFQLHFGNSQGMIEKNYVAETRGDWLKGDIHFGFNITRDFTIKGRKIR